MAQAESLLRSLAGGGRISTSCISKTCDYALVGKGVPQVRPHPMTACEAKDIPLVGGGLESIADSPYNFFIVHVMSCMEKMFAREAAARNIPYFLPLVRMTRYSGRAAGPKKKYRILEPLFKGYVFVGAEGDRDAYRFAQADVMGMPFDRVIRTIPVPPDGQKLLKWELDNLHRGLESEYNIEPFPYLIKGQVCEIVSGSLAGTQGIILDRKERSGEFRIVLQVSMLQGGVSLELDASQVEPI